MIDFHIHSSYSDGEASIMEIARKASSMKLEAIAVLDHGPYHPLGLTEKKTRKRKMEIEEAEATYGIEILDGVEVEIEGDGGLSIPGEFDLVLITSHSIITPAEVHRFISAVKENRVDVIAHFGAFGFVELGESELINMFLDIIESNRVALELNEAYRAPPDPVLELCMEREIMCSVGSDSHTVAGIGKIEWALKCMETYFKGRLIRWWE